MKRSLLLALLTVTPAGCTTTSPQAETPESPKDVIRLSGDMVIDGLLGKPLGEPVFLTGVVEDPSYKGQNLDVLRVQSIDGRPTQRDLVVNLRPFFGAHSDWGFVLGSEDESFARGVTYEFFGYESGGYVGIPLEILDATELSIATTDHHFRYEFRAVQARRTEPLKYRPSDFGNEIGLFRGVAMSLDGRSLLVGGGFTIDTGRSNAWPEDIEGKQIQTIGTYRQLDDAQAFQLVNGDWGFVRVEDMLGREVRIRGRAFRHNQSWWLNYHGLHICIDGVAGLNAIKHDPHWRPFEISGRLTDELLPDLYDPVNLWPSDSKAGEWYVIRDASWKEISALLSPELQPLPDD